MDGWPVQGGLLPVTFGTDSSTTVNLIKGEWLTADGWMDEPLKESVLNISAC